ncbi:hypothetical protein ABW21_db0201200 [Orbilia brochopaga]|nr:hypothetical protein ABW21_db0201200 [Drechslerella brochopaga]
MANFAKIPVEIKLDIFIKTKSTRDLDSLFATCRGFREIQKSKYGEGLEAAVFETETIENNSAELVALANLRAMKTRIPLIQNRVSINYAV